MNPLTSIKDLTSGALKVPKTVADKAVDGLGRVTGVVTSLVPGSKPSAPSTVDTGEAKVSESPAKVHGDPLSTPGVTSTAAKATPTSTPAKKVAAKKAPAARKSVEKPVEKPAPAEKKPAATKSPAEKSPSGKLPATKAPAKKAAEQKPSGKQPTPVNVVEELGLDPAPVSEVKSASAGSAPITAIDSEATAGEVTATPADIATVLDGAAPDEAQGDRPPSPS